MKQAKQIHSATKNKAYVSTPQNDKTSQQGLTAKQAAERLAANGPNVLPGSEPESSLAMIVKILTEPMFLMLLIAGGIYLTLGDRTEALLLLGFVFVIIAITLIEQRKT